MDHTLVIALTDEQEKKLAQAYASHPERVRIVTYTEDGVEKTRQEGVIPDADDLLLRWARHTPVMELERIELKDLADIKAKLTTASEAEIAAVKTALKISAKVVEP